MKSIIPALRNAGVECYTRSQWGSPQEKRGAYKRRARSHPMPDGPAAYHFLHITVTPDTDLPKEGMEAARKMETYGYSTPPLVSYQDLVTNEGRYFQGQDYGTKGTHTVNDKNIRGFAKDLNLRGYACALMQNVGDEVTDRQVEVVAMVFAAREIAGLVRKGAPIYPHRKFAWKGCPGDKAMARLPEIERLKHKYVTEGLPNQEDDMAQYADQLDRIENKLKHLDAELGKFRKRERARDAADKRRANQIKKLLRDVPEEIVIAVIDAANADQEDAS